MFDHFFLESLIISIANAILSLIFSATNATIGEVNRVGAAIVSILQDDITGIAADIAASDSKILAAISAQTGDIATIVDLSEADILAAIDQQTLVLQVLDNQNTGQLKELLGAVSAGLQERIDDSTSTVLSSLGQQSDLLINQANTNTSLIASAIASAENLLRVGADANTARILDILTQRVAEQAAGVNATTATLLDPLQAGIAATGNQLTALDNSVGSGFASVGNALGSVLDILGGGLRTVINNEVIVDASIFDFVVEQVASVINAATNVNATVLGELANVFSGVVTNILSVLFQPPVELVPVLNDIVKAILHNKDINTKVLETTTDEGADGYGGTLINSVFEKLGERNVLSRNQLNDSLVDFIGGPLAMECLNLKEAVDITGEVSMEEGAKWIRDMVAVLLTGLATLQGVGSYKAEIALQKYRGCFPGLVLPPGDAVVALQRGLISEDVTQNILAAHGFDAEVAEDLVNAGYTIPDLGLVYNMHYRGLISEPLYDELLKSLGYVEGILPTLKELAFFIPPVADLVTMAVREVFDRSISEPLGQFEDFPPDFEKFAAQQGVSKEWAERYWAAHWSLPSIQMGFEMMHRGAIEPEELDTLLKALDVMPFWRKPLIDISFRPFTRVDIRRMHRVDVLDDDEVLKAYKDLGYNEEKAGKLTKFVLEINKEDEIFDPDVASDLTRSSILAFYADGILGRTATFALLVQAGVNAGAAELFLLGADFDIERRSRKQQLSIALDRFKFGGLTFTEAADVINAMGFETRENELALLDLDQAREREQKLPSKADLDKFLAARILDEPQYVEMLQRLGYSDLWAGRYLELARPLAA